MKVVMSYMAGKQDSFRAHAFFMRLERNDCPATIKPYASVLTFWVMTFQDILRLNEAQVTDTRLRQVAARHRAEDAGHDRWFLEDLMLLNGSWPDVCTLFCDGYRPVRDAAYALVSELYRAENDHCRLVLLLTLESAGHTFFEKIAAYHERVAPDKPLKYFSRTHMCAEENHQLHERDFEAFVGSIVLSDVVIAQAMAVIDRVYAAFGQMFCGVEEAIIAYQRVHYSNYVAGPCQVCESCNHQLRLKPPPVLPHGVI